VPALERMFFTRIVATPAALDAVVWPDEAIVLRIAPDEALVSATLGPNDVADPHAIVEPETGFCGLWCNRGESAAFLWRECDWELPAHRPAFAQGAIAGLPVKLWLTDDQVLFVVAAPFAADFAERW